MENATGQNTGFFTLKRRQEEKEKGNRETGRQEGGGREREEGKERDRKGERKKVRKNLQRLGESLETLKT